MTTERSQRKRARFLPYRYGRQQLRFPGPEVLLDGAQQSAEVRDDTQHVIALDAQDGWQTLVLEGHVEIPSQVYEQALPSRERAAPPG